MSPTHIAITKCRSYARVSRTLLVVVVGPSGREGLGMNVENVDKVLDEVRPILIADGGNVEVVGTDDGIVLLRLQVNPTCSSSFSST
jgi:hypothetical protein